MASATVVVVLAFSRCPQTPPPRTRPSCCCLGVYVVPPTQNARPLWRSSRMIDELKHGVAACTETRQNVVCCSHASLTAGARLVPSPSSVQGYSRHSHPGQPYHSVEPPHNRRIYAIRAVIIGVQTDSGLLTGASAAIDLLLDTMDVSQVVRYLVISHVM